MAAMTHEQIDACYLAALDVRDGKAALADAARSVHKQTGLDESSARMYINAVLAMLDGRRFSFNISNAGLERYLERIGNEFGKDAQKRAAQGILIKFIEEQRGNKYLNGAMTVLSKDEVDSFIEGYKVHHDVWPLRR